MDPKIKKLIKSLVVETLNESRNTIGADVNEILLGYYLLPGQGWNSFINGEQAIEKLGDRGSEMTQEQWDDQQGRAEAMADATLDWATSNGYNGSVVRAWWTARPGDLSKAYGEDVDSRKNPTDTLIQFSDGQFLGVSAKSAKSGNIGFKNPGIGTIVHELNLPLVQVYEKLMVKIIRKYNLPRNLKSRKTFIRDNPEIQKEIQQLGEKILTLLRDELLKKLQSMPDEDLKQHLVKSWLDAGGVSPRYIQVTGRGIDGAYNATVMDPITNPKIAALDSGNLEVIPVGTNSIGIKANNYRILKMRWKYKSEKLASSIKLSGSSW